MAEERRVEREQEAGVRGGAAEAYVPAYAPSVERALALRDRVRWASVWAGLVVAFAIQIWLTAIGFAILAPGAPAGEVVGGLGLWAAISGLIALFLGGFLASRLAGIAGVVNGLWNGVVLWGLAFTLVTILASIGAGGLLGAMFGGVTTPGAVAPGVPPQQIVGMAATGAWWFVLGQFLGLLAAAAGGVLGSRPAVEEEVTR